jgi:hypothetical protein
MKTPKQRCFIRKLGKPAANHNKYFPLLKQQFEDPWSQLQSPRKETSLKPTIQSLN